MPRLILRQDSFSIRRPWNWYRRPNPTERDHQPRRQKSKDHEQHAYYPSDWSSHSEALDMAATGKSLPGNEDSPAGYGPASSPSLSPLIPDMPELPAPPESPAPAYTALPYRDDEFHFAPLIRGKLGDVELETTDGKRCLVHKKVLEREMVFFHIYYGFVPNWRLQGDHPDAPPHPLFPNSGVDTRPAPSYDSIMSTSAGALAPAGMANTLASIFQLPRAIASALCSPGSSSCRSSSGASQDAQGQAGPPPPPKDEPAAANGRGRTVRPRPVTAPVPTVSPYIWSVPESSSVLFPLLALAYPSGSLGLSVSDLLPSFDLTVCVIRAAMGYQSNRVVSLARDRLAHFIREYPVEVYAMAVFFRFGDLARLASIKAVNVARRSWSSQAREMMGPEGVKRLDELQKVRLEGLSQILAVPLDLPDHAHSVHCDAEELKRTWALKVGEVEARLTPGSELLELLDLDVHRTQCGACHTLLGQTVQRCILQAKELPSSV